VRLHRYPFELVGTVALLSGQRLLLRPIHPQDGEVVQAFVRGLSPRSRYQRFQNAIRELGPELLRRAVHVDHRRHVALIAEVFEDGVETEVGAARYVADELGNVAEFALVVADAWQRRGVGSLLLEKLLRVARSRGVRRLRGDVLHDNEPMLAFARRHGFRIARDPGDARLLVVSKSLEEAPLAQAA